MDHKEDNQMFEEVFKQNEARIHFQLQKLGIRDPHKEFYSEGLYAMWTAYKKYQPDKGPLATYFNYTIRNRLIDKLRRHTKKEENDDAYIHEEIKQEYNGNRYGDSKMPIVDETGIEISDSEIWKVVQQQLTEKQKKWVYYRIICEMPFKEIAEQENTSVEAVKGWGKEAKIKLRRVLQER